MNRYIEEANYHNDRRNNPDHWYDSFDGSKMTATVTFEDEDGVEETRTVPIEFSVCPVCEGRGKHVNPSIDCNGLTADDFAEDPDFREDYFSGVYDQTCNECGGRNVVPVCLDDEVNKVREADRRADAAARAEYLAERRMGA